MAEARNYLIGYGERLMERIAPPKSRPDKNHPYTLQEAKSRLLARIQNISAIVDKLPDSLCPNNRAVFGLTLHPAYLAKSFYPKVLLQNLQLEHLGSRQREITLEKWTRAKHPAKAITAEIFLAGNRDVIRGWPARMSSLREGSPEGEDFKKIERLRVIEPEKKLGPFTIEKRPRVTGELVVHSAGMANDSVLFSVMQFAKLLDLEIYEGLRLSFGNVTFLPVRGSIEAVQAVAQHPFVRYIRQAQPLRELTGCLREVDDSLSFIVKELPSAAMDPGVRVAVFDGGIPKDSVLKPWLNLKKHSSIGDALPAHRRHGEAVCSSLLFGPLTDGIAVQRPYTKIDSWRVLDQHTSEDDLTDLYTVIARIRDILAQTNYEFINLSVGPYVPIEDDDVHPWTAFLDSYLSKGNTVATVAVGNSGESSAFGLNRIMPPSDCVNAIGIGAADSKGKKWQRAAYSSVGPGRNPGFIKPDAVCFGGSSKEPFFYLGGRNRAYPIAGTSFAAPSALRMATGLRAVMGAQLSSAAIKALLLHGVERKRQPISEVGRGRIPLTLEDLLMSNSDQAHILYQNELAPSSWVRTAIPIPASGLTGKVKITATLCFFAHVDPEDAITYTRAGVEVKFRPHSKRRKDPNQQYPDTHGFFSSTDYRQSESDLRLDAHKWETVLQKSRTLSGDDLHEPVFDIHYIAREGGSATSAALPIPFALVITISAPEHPDLYNKIVVRYRAKLEPLRPKVEIPIRV